MAKKMTKAEAQLLVWVVIIGIPIYLISQAADSIGWIALLVIVAAIIGVVIFYKAEQKKQRQKELMEKYQDGKIVNLLMEKSFWQGQTSEQLMDSLGSPVDIDEKVLKTKKKEIWKYNHQGGNRFGLRITLDNDVVVGWDQKS